VVHRGLRYARSQGREGAARRVGGLNNFRKWHDADETIDVFGAERCLFGSRLGEQVARAALHDTVARIYRLN
jgi:hypothetical protein